MQKLPCSYQGCLQYTSRPCPGCGRIGGEKIETVLFDLRQRITELEAHLASESSDYNSAVAGRMEAERKLAEADERIGKALLVILEYGGIDGGHHKQWVIDQVVRNLALDYEKWVENYQLGEDGEQYEWDTGIAP